MRKFILVVLLTLSLSGCGSNSDSGNSDESTGGGYTGCVLDLYQARNAGIITATDAEIQAECRSSSAP
jgi:uncharacterized protein YceK